MLQESRIDDSLMFIDNYTYIDSKMSLFNLREYGADKKNPI